MATVVYYNGVEIHNVTTRQWDEEVVYDSSGTDLLYRRIHMRFQGLAHRNNSGYGGDGSWGPAYIVATGVSGGTSTPDIFNAVRPLLLMPRQQLQVEMNGQSVLNVRGSFVGLTGHGNADMDNGPKPRMAILAHVTGDQVFRIDFAIDCAVDANNSPVDGAPIGGGSVVTNNRWSITETTGDNFAITRSIRGHLRLARWVTNNQDFRTVIVPPLELSFKRERMDFGVSDNGLDCEYTIVDRQVKVAAPWPACKVDGSYTESTNDGTTFWGDCSVTLEGPISASVQLMMVRALQIIDTRLNIVEAKNQGNIYNYQLVAASMTESIGERNVIEAHIRIQHTKESSENGGVATLWSQSFGQGKSGTERILDLSSYSPLPGQPAPYDVWHSQEPALFGYLPGTSTPRQAAFLYLLGCYYQDPWHPQKMNSGFADTSAIGSPPNPAPAVTVSENNNVTTAKATTKLSEETQKATYTFTRLATRYLTAQCKVQLPIAATPTSDTADTSVVASLAGPQTRREIHYDSERIGEPPEIVSSPTTYSDGDGITATLLNAWDRVLPPSLTADKTQTIHRIEGNRLYALNRPPKAGEKMKMGVLPNTNKTQEDNKLALDTLMTARLQA
jgi:hypothetical protein